MTVLLWPDISNVNDKPIEGALAKTQGMSAISAKATEGTGFVDDQLSANHAQAVAVGLPFMAYHYPHSGSGPAQAELFISTVESHCGLAGVALMVDREAADGATTDAFIAEVRQLAPNNALCGYEAAWVVEQFGPSAGMAGLPLIWSNYVGGSGSAQSLLAEVTPGWFEAFGGHSAYAARQYSDAANIGGIFPSDVNVCFDEATFTELFAGAPAPVLAPTPPPEEDDMAVNLLEAFDSEWGSDLKDLWWFPTGDAAGAAAFFNAAAGKSAQFAQNQEQNIRNGVWGRLVGPKPANAGDLGWAEGHPPA